MQGITLANTQSAGIMRFRTVYSFCALTLIALLFVVPKVVALPEKVPRDVLTLRPDGYVYADYPGVFDDVEGKGITVEAWIYLTDKPKDWNFAANSHEGRWNIFAKPSSYFVSVMGRDLSSDIRRGDPKGTTYIVYGVHSRVSMGIFGPEIPSPDFPLNRWVHIAYQISVNVKGNRMKVIWYYDGDGGGFFFSATMNRTDAPLIIGGTKRNGWGWGHRYRFGSMTMKGYIDEVRVSKGFRYGPAERGIPWKRPLRADWRTIALWRFEEGLGAVMYRDSSGNGYHLFPGGSLAVEPENKLATTWGSLKRRVQEAR